MLTGQLANKHIILAVDKEKLSIRDTTSFQHSGAIGQVRLKTELMWVSADWSSEIENRINVGVS